MATAALIGANILSGLGQGIGSAFHERTRQNEFNKMFDFNQDKFNFQKDFNNRQLEQNSFLGLRGQNFGLAGSLINGGMSVGSSLIGNLLSYNHAQDQLNFSKEMYQNQRNDIQKEGLPLSYLHLGGGLQQSMGGNIPMMRTQTYGRSVSNPWGYANSGTNLKQAFGPPPSYQESQSNIRPAAPKPSAYEAGFNAFDRFSKSNRSYDDNLSE